MLALCYCVCGALKDIFFYVTFHHIMQFLEILTGFNNILFAYFFPKQSVINRHVSLTLNFS